VSIDITPIRQNSLNTTEAAVIQFNKQMYLAFRRASNEAFDEEIFHALTIDGKPWVMRITPMTPEEISALSLPQGSC
jgi:hypothetical protein